MSIEKKAQEGTPSTDPSPPLPGPRTPTEDEETDDDEVEADGPPELVESGDDEDDEPFDVCENCGSAACNGSCLPEEDSDGNPIETLFTSDSSDDDDGGS